MPTTPLPGPADTWTATQVRWEMMSWMVNASATYLSPQFITDLTPEPEYIHAIASLDREGYVRFNTELKFTIWPDSSAYVGITPKGHKWAAELAGKGLLVDRSI